FLIRTPPDLLVRQPFQTTLDLWQIVTQQKICCETQKRLWDYIIFRHRPLYSPDAACASLCDLPDAQHRRAWPATWGVLEARLASVCCQIQAGPVIASAFVEKSFWP